MKTEYEAVSPPMLIAPAHSGEFFFRFGLVVTPMPHAELTQHVRQLVAEAFARANMAQPSEFTESILIKGGNYCGRRFVGAGGHAIWFVEENQVKFYAADGQLTQVISTFVRQPALRRAA